MNTTAIKEEFPSQTIEVETPDGVLFYTICDGSEGRPIRVISTFGKAGTSVAAWAAALDAVITLCLERGVGVNELIEILGDITADRQPRIRQGVATRSGPEGIVVALLEYKRSKFAELRRTLSGDIDDEDDGRAHSYE